MKKELDGKNRELGEIKPNYKKYEEDNKRLTKQLATIEGRYQDLQIELQLAR